MADDLVKVRAGKTTRQDLYASQPCLFCGCPLKCAEQLAEVCLAIVTFCQAVHRLMSSAASADIYRFLTIPPPRLLLSPFAAAKPPCHLNFRGDPES